MSERLVLIESEHREGCLAVRREDYPWSGIVKDHVWRDKNGGGRGRTTCFWRIPCNDIECEAALLVRMDDVMREIIKW